VSHLEESVPDLGCFGGSLVLLRLGRQLVDAVGWFRRREGDKRRRNEEEEEEEEGEEVEKKEEEVDAEDDQRGMRGRGARREFTH